MTPEKKQEFFEIYRELSAQKYKIESEIYEYRKLLGKLEATTRTEKDGPTELSAHISYVHHLVLNALNPIFNALDEGMAIAYRRAKSIA